MQGRRILVTAPSNVAVDTLLLKCVEMNVSEKCIRLGHPARVSEKLKRFLLDYQVSVRF